MKRTLAFLLALSAIITLSACGSSGTSSNGGTGDTSSQQSTENSSAADSAGDSESGSPDGDKHELRSNPIAVDENGEIDMTVALKYETDIDALVKSLEAKTPDGSKPVSENTNEETMELFNYLRSLYGKQTLAGQQYSDTKQYEDIVYYTETGDLPAIKGFDFIFSTGQQEINDTQIDEAIKWHNEQNGIVAFCWHWKVPVNMSKENIKGTAFYSKDITDFSFANAVTPGTPEYEVIIKDIDTVALKLQRLESEGVPVLWRPLHEASGSWFWWGIADKETWQNQYYQKLWYMIYDRLENYHKLTNLIWVWNGQDKKAVVNANTYDISGIDVYPTKEDHTALKSSYEKLEKISDSGKMLAISECGYIPDPDLIYAADSEVKWLYFMPWCGEFICNATESGGIITELGGTPTLHPKRATSEFLQRVYNSDKVITLTKLPDFNGNVRKIPDSINMWLLYNPDLKPTGTKLENCNYQ